ncbi:acyl carrier protein [Sciscionella marina]|uniref:acyl carrier protein n=1 Tax=Sciscionella marina TaxID=508770 RepID=UPI00038188F3|nr:acyl carrier protein [Sciscionella marina]
MTDLERLRALVERVIRESASGPVEPIEPDTPLLISGLLDSLTIMKIVGEIEREHGVRLGDAEIVAANFRDVRALCRAVAPEQTVAR